MRYMVMHKVDANMEAGLAPSQDIIQGMGALVGESIKAGIFTDGNGLHRSDQRVRVRCAGGDCSVTRGPYAGENELVAAFALVKAKSMDDAVEHARGFARFGDGEIEIGPVVEAWDLGLVPKPAKLERLRFLFLFKGNATTESAAAPSPAVKSFTAELAKTGALVKSESLAPTSKGTRLASPKGGKRAWVDGPFAESKELIAGYSVLAMPSLQAALAWADRYAAILGDTEVDVREVLD